MKNLLLLLLMFPVSAYSQGIKINTSSSRTEIGLNLGYAPDNAMKDEPLRGGYIRASISLLKNTGNIQYGLTAEGGTNSEDYMYLSPAVLLNRKFICRSAYCYAGAMAGYVLSGDMEQDSYTRSKESMTQGYVFGIQDGFVQPIGKHLSFTSELAVRSTQVWTRYHFDGEKLHSAVIVYFPVTVGLRYRFLKIPGLTIA